MLDEFEQNNIEKALYNGLLEEKMPINKLLSETFIKSLHKRMIMKYGNGQVNFVKLEKTLSRKLDDSNQLRALIDDAKFWIENNSFSEDERQFV